MKKHEKKCRLIAEPRDLIKNNNRGGISIGLEPAGYYYVHWIETVGYCFLQWSSVPPQRPVLKIFF